MNNNQKSLAAAFIVIAVMFFVELAGGIASNSLALLSDAGHMLTDALALVLALLAAVFAGQPATKKQTYGFYRLEILSAFFNGSALTLISGFIFYQAWQKFLHPSPVGTGIMLMVATIGLLANVGAAVILAGSSRESLNVRGAFLHVLSDLGSSLGVIAGGVLIHYTQWLWVDPLLGAMIGCLILWGGVRLVSDSVDILLESTPKGIDLEEVAATIRSAGGVKGIHDLHVWTIASGINAVSAHLVIEDSQLEKGSKILTEIGDKLRSKYAISHATFQTECESCLEGLICYIAPNEKMERGHPH